MSKKLAAMMGVFVTLVGLSLMSPTDEAQAGFLRRQGGYGSGCCGCSGGGRRHHGHHRRRGGGCCGNVNYNACAPCGTGCNTGCNTGCGPVGGAGNYGGGGMTAPGNYGGAGGGQAPTVAPGTNAPPPPPQPEGA